MHQPDRERRHRLGSYGAGTLSCLKSRRGLFILFNDTPIARRGHPWSKAWASLHASWIVTSLSGVEILIQHGGSEGMVVSLHRGRNDEICPTLPNRHLDDPDGGKSQSITTQPTTWDRSRGRTASGCGSTIRMTTMLNAHAAGAPISNPTIRSAPRGHETRK
jgi:hypothetical protein